MWSEIVQDALQNIGHRVFLYYHNKKSLKYRIWSGAAQAVSREKGRESDYRFISYSNERVCNIVKTNDFDLIFSIQGKIDRDSIRKIKRNKPKVRIIYWIGDVLSSKGEEKITDIYEDVDMILLSYRGDYDSVKKRYHDKIHYLPFGVSKKYHVIKDLSPKDRIRFSSDISFVGTYYPEREDALKYLMDNTPYHVNSWGRGWYRSNHLKSRGRLPLG